MASDGPMGCVARASRAAQVAALHAWACLLGIELRLHAHASAADFLATSAPLSAQLVLGLDLDPASTDDLRQVPLSERVAGHAVTSECHESATRVPSE